MGGCLDVAISRLDALLGIDVAPVASLSCSVHAGSAFLGHELGLVLADLVQPEAGSLWGDMGGLVAHKVRIGPVLHHDVALPPASSLGEGKGPHIATHVL